MNKYDSNRMLFNAIEKNDRCHIVTEISNNTNKNTHQMDNKRKLYVLVGLLVTFMYTLHLVYYKIDIISFNKSKSSEVANFNKVHSLTWDEINGKTIIYDLDKYKALNGRK